MRGTIRIANPEQLEAEITIRASLDQWKELREQLGQKWPSWPLAKIIDDLVKKAQDRIESDTESVP